MLQPHLINTFLQETDDLLAVIEAAALESDGIVATAETVNELFRAFHTIKGSAGMFGFDAVSSFTHHIETMLDAVRCGTIAWSQQLLDIVLAAKDHIKYLLDRLATGQEVDEAAGEGIISRIAALPGASAPSSAAPVLQPEAGQRTTWRIQFRPDPALMSSGGNPILLLRDLRSLGPCTVTCHTADVPELDQMVPDQCYLWWDVVLDTTNDETAIRDVFLFVEDGSRIDIERLPAAGQFEHAATAVRPETAQNSPVPAEQESAPSASLRRESSLRVPSGKLDHLVNLVGELVMNQSRLTAAASRSIDPDLAAPVEEIERLVAELRDNVLGIRMMPIGTTFRRFKRLVHDLSAELGKHVDLVTEGAETELDKSVLDQLGDPMVHLIRNSMDHGIENADDRARAGKPVHGTIRLTAVHTGSNVVVRIQDDGRGLNQAVIRQKAIEKQLIAADANLSEKEIFNLIFLPGFSTAAQVTNVSGRGVGMDVVRRQIEALRGSIAVTSEPGQGTCIALTLPLTLAIIDGLLVQVGREQFIVPMSLVTENVELHRSERTRNNGRNVVAVRGELIPYITLRNVFAIGGIRPDIEKIVLVRHEDQRVGLVVDRVIGTHQTVIQSLGTFYRNIEVVSGATIMGDGRVALIIDVAGLVRNSTRLSESAAEDPAADSAMEPALAAI